jgi:transcriptional regulator with XRE-family HTH domain
MEARRLSYVIEQCLRRRRREDRPLFQLEIARFLGVQPITLRRWRSGERPVPRTVEIIFEILHNWPEVSAEAVDKAIERRDNGLVGQKQH